MVDTIIQICNLRKGSDTKGMVVRRLFPVLAFAVMSFITYPSQAQSVKSEVVASNGTPITLYADEFADRYEYSTPTIEIPNLGGFYFAARVNRSDTLGPIRIVGSLMYDGEWRYFTSAIFKGGREATATFTDKEVVSCRGSRFGRGCSYREGFSITIQETELREFAENEVITLQLRSRSSENQLISIPLRHFAALKEVAIRK